MDSLITTKIQHYPNINQKEIFIGKRITKKLSQLIPINIYQQDIKDDPKIEFFKIAQKFITYDEVETQMSPDEMEIPYSEFFKRVGGLKNVENFRTVLDDYLNSQIRLLSNDQNIKFVLKKFWIFFDSVIFISQG